MGCTKQKKKWEVGTEVNMGGGWGKLGNTGGLRLPSRGQGKGSINSKRKKKGSRGGGERNSSKKRSLMGFKEVSRDKYQLQIKGKPVRNCLSGSLPEKMT